MTRSIGAVTYGMLDYLLAIILAIGPSVAGFASRQGRWCYIFAAVLFILAVLTQAKVVRLAVQAGWDYLIVDGVNIPTERVAARYTKKQHWYSGKHKRHGGAVQTVAAPDGELLWVSGVLPGRTVDITAARRFKIADKVLEFLGLLADLGYIGLHPDIVTGYKRKRGEKTLPEAKKAANRAQASLRCLGERANAQLKCWRVLTCDFRGNPRQLTAVVKAVQTLQYLIRDPFGTGRIDIVS